MLTLGIDTSATTASVALVQDGQLISDFSLTGGLTHSEHLVGMIESALGYAGYLPKDIDLYAVSNGPGSFTGIRIGVSTVKGMAFAQDTPCVGISTLEALAYRLRLFNGILCPVMDARRNEFYNALFSCKDQVITRLTPERAISAADLDKELSATPNAVVNGDGGQKLMGLLSQGLPVMLAPQGQLRQSAVEVALLGEVYHAQQKSVSCQTLSPVYLRMPQAERELLQKQKGEIK